MIKVKSAFQTFFIFLAIIAFFISTADSVIATNYYVDKNSIGGQCDNNSSGTITEPWCSWSKVFWDKKMQLQPGDTVFLRNGVYEERFQFHPDSSFSGTYINPINIRPYQNETIVFDGSNIGGNGIYIPGDNSYINISGPIEIKNFSKALETDGSITKYGWKLDKITAHDCGRGLLLRNFNDIEITNSVIYSNNGYGEGGGVFIYYGSTNVRIENVISHSHNDGRGVSGDADGFWADETAGTINMKNVISYGNSEDGFDLKAENVVIENGKSYDNTTCGIKIWYGSYDISNFVTYNNGEDGMKVSEASFNLRHIVSAGNGESGLQFRSKGGEGSIANSIFCNNKISAIDMERLESGKVFNVNFNHNLYFHSGESVIQTTSCEGYDYSSEDLQTGKFDTDLKNGIICGSAYPLFTGIDTASISQDPLFINAPTVFASSMIASEPTQLSSVVIYTSSDYIYPDYEIGNLIELNNDNILRAITNIEDTILYFENNPLTSTYSGDYVTGKGVRIVDWGISTPFDVNDNYELKAGSPAINTGLYIEGFHCQTADDDSSSPMDPSASCYHWTGSSPDIGVNAIGAYDWEIPYSNELIPPYIFQK